MQHAHQWSRCFSRLRPPPAAMAASLTICRLRPGTRRRRPSETPLLAARAAATRARAIALPTTSSSTWRVATLAPTSRAWCWRTPPCWATRSWWAERSCSSGGCRWHATRGASRRAPARRPPKTRAGGPRTRPRGSATRAGRARPRCPSWRRTRRCASAPPTRRSAWRWRSAVACWSTLACGKAAGLLRGTASSAARCGSR
mmetsp:Transcript_2119/g.6998  ORF Transcript_2119/g.6998 Transcript_2119/m.6998 type:complete len:201 (+) Transcript_2119:373-975(+)